MAIKYLDLTFTESVCRAQKQYYGNVGKIVGAPERDLLTQTEAEFAFGDRFNGVPRELCPEQ